MSSGDKRLNELLRDLRRPSGTRPLKDSQRPTLAQGAPHTLPEQSAKRGHPNSVLDSLSRHSASKPLKKAPRIPTHKTPSDISWGQVRKGCQLRSVKRLIPREDVVAPVLSQKGEAALVEAATRFLHDTQPITCPDGLVVHLDVPDRDPANRNSSIETLKFRAKHLCGGGGNLPHEYTFNETRAKYVGCIAETLKSPAIIAQSIDNKRFYLRRYSDNKLHMVLVGLPRTGENNAHVSGVAYERKSNGHIVTQYPSDSGRCPEEALVIYKNPNI